MALSIASCSIFILPLLLASIHGSGARKIMDHHHHPHHHHHQNHVSDNLDESNLIFFTLKDLEKGKTLPIYLPRRRTNSSSSPKFLSEKEAESIPFNSRNLSHLLHLFSFPAGSPQAEAVETTLHECELPPIAGETKLCATSLESMLDYVTTVLGDVDIKVLATAHVTEFDVAAVPFQNFTIREVPREVEAAKMVACHAMAYPYAVFYCHSQKTKNKVFEVSLVGEINGDKVEAVAVCHLDTSQWSSDHVSFRVLGIEPGTSHVCHFFPADNLVWVPNTATVI